MACQGGQATPNNCVGRRRQARRERGVGQSYDRPLHRGAMEDQRNPDNSISAQLSSVLAQLSTDQIRFAVARQEYPNDKEAAKAIGLKPDTVYHWPAIVGEAVRLMVEDGVTTALHVRRRALAKAMLVKAAGLDSPNEQIKQGVATEFIEWELGTATQKHELGGKDGADIVIRTVGGVDLGHDV